MAEINLIALVVNIFVNVIVLSPVLWIAGRLLAGKDKENSQMPFGSLFLEQLLALFFKPFSKVGGFHMDSSYGGASLGTGLRTGLSFIILKVDFAWRTDFDEVAGYRTHVSIGGEF